MIVLAKLALCAVLVTAVVLGVAFSTPAHPGTIRPEDQALAQKLSIRESDLPGGAGVRMVEPASNRVRTTECAGEPQVLGALTGFRDSPTWFVEEVGPVYFSGAVRVFSSKSVATRWFKWATSRDGLPLCIQRSTRTRLEEQGYTVNSARRFPYSFKTGCTGGGGGKVDCPRHTLKAWGIEVRASKQGERGCKCADDLWLVKVNRVVLSFASQSEGEWFHKSGWEAISWGIVFDVLSRFPKEMW